MGSSYWSIEILRSPDNRYLQDTIMQCSIDCTCGAAVNDGLQYCAYGIFVIVSHGVRQNSFENDNRNGLRPAMHQGWTVGRRGLAPGRA